MISWFLDVFFSWSRPYKRPNGRSPPRSPGTRPRRKLRSAGHGGCHGWWENVGKTWKYHGKMPQISRDILGVLTMFRFLKGRIYGKEHLSVSWFPIAKSPAFDAVQREDIDSWMVSEQKRGPKSGQLYSIPWIALQTLCWSNPDREPIFVMGTIIWIVSRRG